MCADGIAELLQLFVDRVLAERRLKRLWIKEDVDVFRKALDEIPTFRQTGAALEDHVVTGRRRDGPKGLRNVVVFFDDRGAQPAAAEVFSRLENGLVEVR